MEYADSQHSSKRTISDRCWLTADNGCRMVCNPFDRLPVGYSRWLRFIGLRLADRNRPHSLADCGTYLPVAHGLSPPFFAVDASVEADLERIVRDIGYDPWLDDHT